MEYFILYHEYTYGDKNKYTERKNLGVFSSEERAKKAIPEYMKQPGFCDYGPACFKIIRCEPDKPFFGSIIKTRY